jgi:hypothetical protein
LGIGFLRIDGAVRLSRHAPGLDGLAHRGVRHAAVAAVGPNGNPNSPISLFLIKYLSEKQAEMS